MRTMFTGVGTALITPFTKSGALDEAAIKRLARRQIDAGVHFLVPCGTTGETPTLSAAERRRVVELVLEAADGQVPVMAGAGGYDTQEVVHVAKEMQSIGVQGLLSVTPYYNKPTPEGLYQHFSKIAEATPLPIMLYNVPGRTGCNIDAATCAKLATIPHVIGVKEASGNITQMVEICRAVPPDFLVLSGDDALTLPLMAIGGRGLISVASNAIPAEMSKMVEAAERGDFAGARLMHHHVCAADARQLHRVEPRPGQVRDGGDGTVRRGLSAADGVAAAGVAGEDSRVPEGAGDCAGSCRSWGLSLQSTIEALAAAGAGADRAQARAAFDELKAALEKGTVRSAEPDASSPTGWRVNTWVKQGILLGFRFGDLVDQSAGLPFYDKDTQTVQRSSAESGIRIVPGGSAVRGGAYVARGVICMPPMYINIGAYIGEGSLVDSHALVGSCAQIGARVHVSAAAQIGGVLEPVGAMPVIVEDDVLVGGNTGIYEGAVIKQRAVIAAGTVLTGSTPVYDLVNGTIIKPAAGQPLVIPQGAVVVPGARAVTVGAGKDWGLSLATPVIVKYRDDKTDSRTELEQWIR